MLGIPLIIVLNTNDAALRKTIIIATGHLLNGDFISKYEQLSKVNLRDKFTFGEFQEWHQEALKRGETI